MLCRFNISLSRLRSGWHYWFVSIVTDCDEGGNDILDSCPSLPPEYGWNIHGAKMRGSAPFPKLCYQHYHPIGTSSSIPPDHDMGVTDSNEASLTRTTSFCHTIVVEGAGTSTSVCCRVCTTMLSRWLVERYSPPFRYNTIWCDIAVVPPKCPTSHPVPMPTSTVTFALPNIQPWVLVDRWSHCAWDGNPFLVLLRSSKDIESSPWPTSLWIPVCITNHSFTSSDNNKSQYQYQQWSSQQPDCHPLYR
jgi:hypothetical protein